MPRLTSRQFAEWMAYAKVEPFGPVREDYRAGVLAEALINLFGRRKGDAPVRWTEMFPEHKPRTRKGSEREERNARIAGTFMVLASMAGKG